MIRVCKDIQGVGRFVDYSSDGQDFKRLTLVYGENGSGKTTMARLLRSAGSGDTDIMEALHTLDAEDPAYVKLATSDGDIELSEWAWADTLDDVAVYDSSFVHNNVFAGNTVEHRHKKNMYRLVVGEKGVNLTEQEEHLKQEAKDLRSDIKDIKTEITKLISSNMTASEFVDLDVSEEDIEEKLSNTKKKIDIYDKKKKIKDKPSLEGVELPSVPNEEILEILGKSLDSIEKRAEDQVAKHINTHLDEDGEDWLEKGYNYSSSSHECPYCGQNINNIDLIEAYKGYFSKEYDKLKNKIKEYRNNIRNILGERELTFIHKIISKNEQLIEFWSEHIDIEKLNLSFDDVRDIWVRLRKSLLKDIENKESGPLEEVDFSEEAVEAISSFENLKIKVERYNEKIESINKKIEDTKGEADKSSKSEEIKNLKVIKDKRKRKSEEVKDICKEYEKKESKLNETEKRREEAREKANEYTKKVFEEYQSDINKYLTKFGAKFGIVNMKTSRRGKKLSSKYSINVRGEEVNIGGKGVDEGTPEFGTALSTGDKNTLAYALFCAQMEKRNLSDTIVVIDDPVTSLDIHREENAAQEVIKISKRAKQTIILSHNPHFLHTVHNHRRNNLSQRLLKIKMLGDKSVITKWEKYEDLRDEFRKDINKLREFIEKGVGEKVSVCRSIRPVIEAYIQVAYHGLVNPKGGIAEYISCIRSAEPGSDSLAEMKEYLADLNDIKDFTDPFMHGRYTPQSQPPAHQAVCSYAERALEIIRP